MRLSWPFGRGRSEGETPGDAPAHGDLAPAAAPPGGGAAAAWRSLPPLAETIGPPPVVAPAKPFAASLAADNPPPPILRPLSHGRGLEAPSGIVVGVAKPVAAAHGSPTPPPVQRSPLRPRSSEATSEATFEPVPGPGAASVPAELPRLSVASDTPPTPARSLVRSGAAAAAAPPPGLVLQPRAAGSPSHAAAPNVQRAPATPAPEMSAPASHPLGTPSPTALKGTFSPPDGAGPNRLSVGQVRRLGLGAPIGGGPIGGSPGGAFDGGGRHSMGSASPMSLVQRAPSTAGAPHEPDPAASAAPDGGTATPAPPEAGGPALVQRAPESGTAAPTTYAAPALASMRSPSPAPGLREGSVPLASARRLRTAVQRSPLSIQSADDEAAGKPTGAGLPAGAGAVLSPTATATDGPVKVHRDQAAGDISKSLDARSFTHGGEIFLPSSHGPLTSGAGRSLLAHELTHVTQQRRMGASLPDERSPHGQALESEAVAAERSGQLPLAGSASRPAGEPSRSGPGSATPSATRPQRADAEAHDHAALGADSVSAGSGVTTIELPGAQRASKTPVQPMATAPQPPRTYSEPELEDLAHKLYARIGRRLRRELLVDRERAGLAIDLG
jgi:hypothetical protein